MLRRNWWFASSLALGLVAGQVTAALCVWRQPDSDIAGMFGSGGSYRTVFADISAAQRARIEKRLGFALDPDETQFKFFPVYRGGKQVGTVMTHAGKGQFGAIEVVVAVVPTESGTAVREVRIQRDREKAKAALRSQEFLGQFRGMRVNDEFRLMNDEGRGTNDRTGLKAAAPGAEKASQAVANAVRKLLVVHDELGLNRIGKDQ